MSGRQPDATANGISSAKKHRLSVLSQKHSSNKRQHVSSSTQAASKSSTGLKDPKTNLGRTEANSKDDVIYSGLKRSQLCEQLQAVIPKAKQTAVIQDPAADFLDSLMANTEAAGTGAQAIQRNAKHSHLHLENPIVPTSARKKSIAVQAGSVAVCKEGSAANSGSAEVCLLPAFARPMEPASFPGPCYWQQQAGICSA